MALHFLDSDIVRNSCRQRLETCELWLRRLIHDQFVQEFGNNYIQTAFINGQNVFRREIRQHVEARIRSQPERYPREIDSLLLDHLSSIICKEDVYRKYFGKYFADGFPLGSHQLRLVLDRLVVIRNALSHANPLSLHDAERVLCYCSDIIDTLSRQYAILGMQAEYNAPSFTRYSDSLGNVVFLSETKQHLDFRDKIALQCGQSIRFEVEVDSHFQPAEYSVLWQVCNVGRGEGDSGNGLAYCLTLEPYHVSNEFSIMVTLTSNKEWHRQGSFDAVIFTMYKVLPPL